MTNLGLYLNNNQITLLILGCIFFLLSLLSFVKNKEKFVLIFVGLTAISVFSFSALLDPFLNLWDERFHALVAKNLMNHPLMPTLYDNPIVDMEYDRWDRSHIWLHKQPLFLWQIALSFKIFGVSEFTLRLPNIVLGTLLVLITYRSGKLLVNKQVGYISSLLVVTSIYLIELISGRQELEHNDFAFLVYVSLSIWSFIEYYYTQKKYWIYLIGLFSGMAILCKWLVGLLVYFGWFVLKIAKKKIRLSENKDLLIALLITLLIALPWQILTFVWYPTEAMNEYKYNSLHFITPIEGHGGSFWYHFEMFSTIYGKFAPITIVPAIIVLYKKVKDKKIVISLFSMVLFVYLFFSLAATKMPSFTIIVSMTIFIAYATFIHFVIDFINQYIQKLQIKHLVFCTSIIILSIINFDFKFLLKEHTFWNNENHYSEMLLHNKKVFKSLELSSNAVLFNVKGRHYIEAMFYTGLPAYNFIPSVQQYQDMKRKNKKLAIFKNDDAEIPNYLKNDSTILFIHEELKGYD